jgi:Protein of unknown function (DUF4197)
MKRRRVFLAIMVLASVAFMTHRATAQLGNIMKQAQESLGLGGGLSEAKIADGLKQALEVGTAKAVDLVSKTNGYFNNPQIKIPLPQSVQKVEKILRTAGLGSQMDAFDLSMNRAAEQAAPEAKALFLGAVKDMSIDDAKKILNGPDNAATQYLRGKTGTQLAEKFKPIVHNAMAQVGVTKSYQDLEAKVKGVPFGPNISTDLDQHVTDKALDGLFTMLAEEEKKIRQDPAARVTDLLKEVFGGSH